MNLYTNGNLYWQIQGGSFVPPPIVRHDVTYNDGSNVTFNDGSNVEYNT
jgi:hypothetical protein